MGRGRKKATPEIENKEVLVEEGGKAELKKKAIKKRVFPQAQSNPLDKMGEDEILDSFVARNNEIVGNKFWDAETISTGNFTMDHLLGGGFPTGAVTEIFAEEGVGKTSLLIDTALGLQRDGYGSAIFDLEDGWKVPYLQQRGGIINDPKMPNPILLGKFETVQEVDMWMEKVVLNPKIKFLVLDSYQGLVPEEILKERVGKVRPGLQAQLSGTLLIKVLKLAKRSGKALVVVTQLRTKFDFAGGHSGPEAAGGWAIRYWTSVRLELRKRGFEKRMLNDDPLLSAQEAPYGQWVEGYSWKNRMTAPYRKGLAFLEYGKGFTNLHTIFITCCDAKIIEAAGSWYSTMVGPTGEEVKMQGKESMMEYVDKNQELFLAALVGVGYDLRNP